jgi:CubicO group peptidase (beta-lactamase class C family)
MQVDSLDAYISKLMKEYRMPGMAIGVIHNDTVLFKKGFGTTSNIGGHPVTTKTIFPIMSCTKAFTAACLGILVDEGKLNWNDKVIEHLPWFKLSDPWITKELTISDLLTHRSGLRAFDGDLLWYASNYSRMEVMEKIQHYPISGSFRLDFNYNNVMYLVAGGVIEKVSGMTWDNFLKMKILEPLGMSSSSTSLSELTATPNYALPHIANKPIIPRNTDNIGPAGSINSNIDDMLKWLQLMLEKGRLRGKELLENRTYNAITSPQIIIDDQSSYGYGWYIDYEEGQKVFSHGGGMPGYKSLVALYPKHKIGIVVLTNKISMINEGLVNMIASFLINPKLIDWSNNRKYFTYFGYSWDKPKIIGSETALPNNFQKYMGSYEDKVYGKAEINFINETALLELLPSKKLLTGKLYFLSDSTFKIHFEDEFLPIGKVLFQLDESGNVLGFTLDVPNDDFNFDNLNFLKLKM